MKPGFYLLVFLFITGTQSFSQAIPEKTLLWRIDGNGTSEPSYVYGTMHLYDQRLFNFGDSVYKALESSKGFANEIDPAIFLDSLFAEIVQDRSARLKDMVDEKKYKEISKKLKDKLGIEPHELTNKKISEKRSAWYYNQRSKDDMDAVVDFFLYDVAKKQGKTTGGIEDYADQKNLFDEVGSAVDIEEFANENPSSWKKNLNKFIDMYLEQDIEKLYRVSSGGGSAFNAKKVLDDRNIKMAYNMDSLMHIRSTFFAVGAAHLAGEKGLINLMRAKGFRVTPVFSDQKLHAKKYSFMAAPVVWQTIAANDNSYTVKMPGKANDVKISDDVPVFKMYADFGNTLFYMSTAMPAIQVEKDSRLTLSKSVDRFVSGAGHKDASTKYFTYKGNPAVEVSSAKDGVHFKINLILKDERIYLLMAGAQKKNVLDIPDTEKFFQSLETNDAYRSKPTGWQKFTDGQLAVELDFPGKPVRKTEVLEEEALKSWTAATISASDMKTGGYYSMVLLETVPGLVITDDSSVLKSKLDIFAGKDFTIITQEYFNWDGYPAMKYKAKLTEDGYTFLLDVVTLNRINRNLTAMAVVPDTKQGGVDAAKFIKSFRLLDFETGTWQNHTLPGNTGSTWGPGAFVTDTTASEDGYSDDEGRVEFMTDKNNTINYGVNVTGFDPYFFRPDEDSLLREIAATFYSDTTNLSIWQKTQPIDSLIYIKKISNGPKKGLEVLVRQPAVHQYKRIRIFLNADSLYKLIVFGPLKNLEEKNTIKFFEDFRFTNPSDNRNLFTNRSREILYGLSATDSTIRAQTRIALGQTTFSKAELPLLHEAMLKAYPHDTVNYYKIYAGLAEKIVEIADSSSIAFIEKEYPAAAKTKDEKAVNMLSILAQIKTKESYQLLKKCWLSAPPLSSGMYSLGDISDSLELTALLFPELQALYADTLSANALLNAAAYLLDSNTVSKENILSEKTKLYEQARWQLLQYSKDSYIYSTYSLIKLLAALNTTESISLVKEFTMVKDSDLSMTASTALLEKDISLPGGVLEKLAGDPNQRISLFETLQKTGKEKLFPKKYNNQVSFAESQLATLSGEDDVYVKSATLLNTHKAEGKNGAVVYYSFKIMGDDESSYLGFIGPYSKNQLQAPAADLRYELLYDVPFTKSSVQAQFKTFMEEAAAE